MADIYYSKRSGAETDRILDKANAIKINEQPTEDILLNTIKIGDTIYKPNIPKYSYVYIHLVEIYFEYVSIYSGRTKLLSVIDNRKTPYTEGAEYEFFKSFGGGVLLDSMRVTSDIRVDCVFYCTQHKLDTHNGNFATYYQPSSSNHPFTWIGATARIIEDTMYTLRMEEL